MATTNVSDGRRSIELQMSSSLLVSIDPLVLDGLTAELQKLSPSEVAAHPELIRALPGPMKVGLHRVEDFVPGTYRVANDDVEAVNNNRTDLDVFDIDTGTLILADLGYLPRLAQILTWERYDLALQSPVDDDSSWLRFAQELGGPFFGILWGDIDTPFKGDGSYRIKSGSPRLVTQHGLADH
jgi:hypothetical protein